MQQISIYLYPNSIDVFTNLETWTKERYRKVYNRNLKVYGGTDNRINIQIRNQDQKTFNISGSTVVFSLIGRDKPELILEKDCQVIDADLGKLYFKLLESELIDIEPGLYDYSFRKEVRTQLNDNEYIVTDSLPLYSDSQYGVVGTIEILGSVQGLTTPSTVIKEFAQRIVYSLPNLDYYESGIINARPEFNTPQSLHTFQLYFSNFSGQVKIQGSLSEGANPKVWTDIQTLTYTNASLEYVNLTGKYNWFRVKYTPTAGKVDKVLYR